MFSLTTTEVKLATMTPRTEKHGDEDVSAVSLGLRLTAANTLLDALDPNLRMAIYAPVEGQDQLPGVEPSTPVLRPRMVESLKLSCCFEGWTVAIDRGIDEDDPIKLGGAKVDKFVVVPHEGGSVDIAFRVGSSDIDETEAGWLFGHLGQPIVVSITPPEKAPDAIDGSTEAFQRDHPGADDGQADLLDEEEAGEAFARLSEDPGPDDDDGTGSEGGDADAGADEQAEIEAGMRESLEAAGLREKPARRGRRVAAVE